MYIPDFLTISKILIGVIIGIILAIIAGVCLAIYFTKFYHKSNGGSSSSSSLQNGQSAPLGRSNARAEETGEISQVAGLKKIFYGVDYTPSKSKTLILLLSPRLNHDSLPLFLIYIYIISRCE